jgi:hypothetical protein
MQMMGLAVDLLDPPLQLAAQLVPASIAVRSPWLTRHNTSYNRLQRWSPW